MTASFTDHTVDHCNKVCCFRWHHFLKPTDPASARVSISHIHSNSDIESNASFRQPVMI